MPVTPEVDWDHLTEEQKRIFVEAIRMIARWGREALEAPRNAVYEGMTPEERDIAVYEKCNREGLEWEDMTLLERRSWLAEYRGQMAEQDRQHEGTKNAFWNIDRHSFLIDRIRGGVYQKLTAEEQAAFMELLRSCH